MPKVSSLQDYTVNHGGWFTFDRYPRLLGDIDGDGKDDIIAFTNPLSVAFGKDTAPYFENPITFGTSFGYGSPDFDYTSFNSYPRCVADVDGDGKDDIIGFEHDSVYVAFSNGRSGFEPKLKIVDHYTIGDGGYTNYQTYPRFFADFNGDGKADLISVDGGGLVVRFSEGRNLIDRFSGLRIDHFYSATYTSQNFHPRMVGDIDGDGLADIVGFAQDKVEVSFSTGTSLLDPVTILENDMTRGFTWSNFDEFPRYLYDYNRDGKMDLVGISSTHFLGRISNGRSTVNSSEPLYSGFGRTDPSNDYDSQDVSPRQVGDINGDGLMDIVAFGVDGIEVALGQKTCSHSTRDVTLDCACKPGFYDAGDGAECPSCTYPCENCTSSSCLSCAHTAHRLDTTSCDCQPGYYDDNTIQCHECPERYGTCSNNTTPLSCDGLQRKSTADDCVCNDGYYEDPLTVNCLECPERYGSCSDDTTPLTCDGLQRKTTVDDCVCNDGYYEDPLTVNCLQCPERYGTCTNDTTPLSCDGLQRKPKEDDCLCIDGYYEDPLTVNCLECPKRYASCTDNTTPLSCDGLQRKTTADDCLCNDGYYEDPLSVNCLQCRERYGTCSDEITPLTCKGNNRKTTVDDCVCSDGFFEDPLSDDCIPCVYPCSNCTSPTDCDGCRSSQSLRKTSSSCECNDGYYDNNAECVQCSYPCVNCSSPTQCIGTCHTTANRNSAPTCSCLDGFYEDTIDQICKSCVYPCLLCSDQSNCLSCRTTENRISLTNCNCQDGFFDDNSQCSKCNYSRCKTCSGGSDQCIIPCSSECAQCNPDDTCRSCELGKYLKEGSCLVCNPKCFTCDISPDNCLQCNPHSIGRSQNPIDSCKCLDGFYENGSNLDCVECTNPKCKTCNSTGDCLECFSDQVLPPLCNSESSKKKGFLYEEKLNPITNKTEIISTPCDIKWEKCESSVSNCTKCRPFPNRSMALPCDCKEGFHDNYGETPHCEKCPLYCKKCLSADQCLECEVKEKRELNRFSGQCECIKGFKENSNGDCKNCFQYQGKCLSECPQYTKLNEDKQSCISLSKITLSNTSIIWVGASFVFLILIFITIIFVAKGKKIYKKLRQYENNNQNQKKTIQKN